MRKNLIIKVILKSVVVCSILLGIFILASLTINAPSSQRLMEDGYIMTEMYFFFHNGILQQFYDVHARYPEDVDEFKEFFRSVEGDYFPPECIQSDVIGRGTRKTKIFADELDGTGGWYYDHERKIIVPNYTKPLNHYLSGYKGRGADEILADWTYSRPEESDEDNNLDLPGNAH